MGYQIIGHTADVRMRVRASNRKDLFRDALRGMFSLIKKEKSAETFRSIRLLRIHAADATALLVDFLNEALALSHINGEVYREAAIEELSETSLRAELQGMRADVFDEDIKAVTYHEAEVRRNEKGEWETMLVFDI